MLYFGLVISYRYVVEVQQHHTCKVSKALSKIRSDETWIELGESTWYRENGMLFLLAFSYVYAQSANSRVVQHA